MNTSKKELAAELSNQAEQIKFMRGAFDIINMLSAEIPMQHNARKRINAIAVQALNWQTHKPKLNEKEPG